MKVLAEHNIDYTAFFEDTSKTMEDYVARFGKEINAVWAPWDEPAQAAVNVLNAAGLKDVKVIGIDGHPQAVAEVCKPDSQMIATVSQPFEKMGVQVGEWIQDIVVDKKNPDDVLPSKTVYMDAPLITKKNCKRLHGDLYAGRLDRPGICLRTKANGAWRSCFPTSRCGFPAPARWTGDGGFRTDEAITG